jgi:hypothetical protein
MKWVCLSVLLLRISSPSSCVLQTCRQSRTILVSNQRFIDYQNAVYNRHETLVPRERIAECKYEAVNAFSRPDEDRRGSLNKRSIIYYSG